MNFKIILILLCLFIGACKTTNEEVIDGEEKIVSHQEDKINNIVDDLTKKYSSIKSIVNNINTSRSGSSIGEKEFLLYGDLCF